MSRFYETTDPRFVDDFIYKSPLELAEKVSNKIETNVDNMVGKELPLLEDTALKTKFINDPKEREIVEQRVKYYGEKTKELTEKIKNDPVNYRKYMPELDNIRKELKTDLTVGTLSKAEASYNALENYKETNKQLLKDQPGAYWQGLNHLMNKWKSNENRSLDSPFESMAVQAKPDIEWEKISDKIKANTITKVNGMWIDKETGISKERIDDLAWATIQSDPNYHNFINQQKEFGVKGWDVNPFRVAGFQDKDGKVYSEEDMGKLTEIQLKNLRMQPVVDYDPMSNWTPDIRKASLMTAYSNKEKEMNQVANADANRNNAIALKQMDIKMQREKMEEDRKVAAKKLINDLGIDTNQLVDYESVARSMGERKQAYETTMFSSIEKLGKGAREAFAGVDQTWVESYKKAHGGKPPGADAIARRVLEVNPGLNNPADKESVKSIANDIYRASEEASSNTVKAGWGKFKTIVMKATGSEREAEEATANLKKKIDVLTDKDERFVRNIGNVNNKVIIDGKSYNNIQDYYTQTGVEKTPEERITNTELDIKTGRSTNDFIVDGSMLPYYKNDNDYGVAFKIKGKDGTVVDVIMNKNHISW
jgi:hypothetical protein